jgi:hypothetical protein
MEYTITSVIMLNYSIHVLLIYVYSDIHVHSFM